MSAASGTDTAATQPSPVGLAVVASAVHVVTTCTAPRYLACHRPSPSSPVSDVTLCVRPGGAPSIPWHQMLRQLGGRTAWHQCQVAVHSATAHVLDHAGASNGGVACEAGCQTAESGVCHGSSRHAHGCAQRPPRLESQALWKPEGYPPTYPSTSAHPAACAAEKLKLSAAYRSITLPYLEGQARTSHIHVPPGPSSAMTTPLSAGQRR